MLIWQRAREKGAESEEGERESEEQQESLEENDGCCEYHPRKRPISRHNMLHYMVFRARTLGLSYDRNTAESYIGYSGICRSRLTEAIEEGSCVRERGTERESERESERERTE